MAGQPSASFEIASTVRSFGYWAASRSRLGISMRQGGHQLAHRLTITTRPCRSTRRTECPARSVGRNRRNCVALETLDDWRRGLSPRRLGRYRRRHEQERQRYRRSDQRLHDGTESLEFLGGLILDLRPVIIGARDVAGSILAPTPTHV